MSPRYIAVFFGEMWEHPIVGAYVPPPPPADPSRHPVQPMIAFQDIIDRAAYKRLDVRDKDRVLTLDRGQFRAGRSYWAKRWNWGDKSVRSFFDRLAAHGMIKKTGQSAGHYTNVATICNYDKYQSGKAATGPELGPEPGQSRASDRPEPGQNTTKTTKTTESPLPPKGAARAATTSVREVARQAFDEWRELAKRHSMSVPRETSFNDRRAQAIFAVMADQAGSSASAGELLDVWRAGLANVERSAFLLGKTSHQFRTTLAFLCQKSSFAKLIDGGFGNGAHAVGPVGSGHPKSDGLTAEQRARVMAAREAARMEGGHD